METVYTEVVKRWATRQIVARGTQTTRLSWRHATLWRKRIFIVAFSVASRFVCLEKNGYNNMFEHYVENARRTVLFARYEAANLGSSEIIPEHILLGLLNSDPAVAIGIAGDVSAREIRDQILAYLSRHETQTTLVDTSFSPASHMVLAAARAEAERFSNNDVTNLHILFGLMHVEDCFAARLLRRVGFSADYLREQISILRKTTEELAPQTADATAVLSASGNKLFELEGRVIELFGLNDHRGALKLVDDAIADPGLDRNQAMRGLVQIASVIARTIGDVGLARRYCEHRVACDPDDAMALFELADCLALLGETNEADKIAHRSYKLVSEQGTRGRDLAELIEHRFPEIKPEA